MPPSSGGSVRLDRFDRPEGAYRVAFRPKLAAVLTAATLAALAALTLTPAAGAKGAEKETLLRFPSGNCNIGATGGVETDAFAVINIRDTELSATVSIKDGTPNATYSVSLVQTPSGENCFTAEATLTTNAQGNGTVHLEETRLPGTTGAFVLVQGPSFDLRVTKAVAA